MPLSDDIRAELEATFAAEVDERLSTMNGALLTLERAPDDERERVLDSLLRDAHSLKGGAQLLGWLPMDRLCHALESHLAAARTQSAAKTLDAALVFAALDAIALLKEPRAGVTLPKGLIEALEGTEADPPGGDGIDVASAERLNGIDVPSAPASTDNRSPVPSPTGMIRVSTERLDGLMDRAGDLIALRDGAQRYRSGLAELVREIEAWRDAWKGPLAETAGLLARPERQAAHVNTALKALLDGGERLRRLTEQLRTLARTATIENLQVGRVVGAIEADLLALRLVPARSLFRQFGRMVRDLSTASGKTVRLVELGWDTPMDREMLERLKDPLLHILRNAIDHGLESPTERAAAGKDETGTIILEAAPHKGGVLVSVTDDGRGIDIEAVRRRAVARGLPSSALETDDPAALIFEPGFSTAERVGGISGRGVGLDVVRQQVHALGGSVRVEPRAGGGSTFLLELPLTLVSLAVLVVRAGSRRFGIPLASVERVVTLSAEDAVDVVGRSAIALAGEKPVVLADLGQLLGVSRDGVEPGRQLVAILSSSKGRAGITIDGLEGGREVVVKDLGGFLGVAPLLAGAALIEDDVLLVVDPSGVVDAVLAERRPATADAVSARTNPAAVSGPARILVVDDSITTRTLEKNILSAVGFDVLLAADGLEALNLLRSASVDLVVTDVDMPRLDGVSLTERIRADEAMHDLPVILVTAKERPDEQERGLRAGASAYLGKSTFDQHGLLAVIRDLIG